MINFFYGKHKLRMFIIRLKAFILGLDDAKNISFGSSDECEFGKWLNGIREEHMGNSLIGDQLAHSHETIHQIARKIEDYMNIDDYENARKEFIKVHEERERLEELLSDIEKEYNQQEKLYV